MNKRKMRPLMCQVALSLIYVFIVQSSALGFDRAELDDSSYERSVTAEINPRCPGNRCDNFTLIYVQQKGIKDVLHHLWTMENIPTFFYARTALDTELEINWDDLLIGNHSQAISFTAEPQYFAAVMITNLIMYNDLNDTGMIPDDSFDDVTLLNPKMMSWTIKSSNFSSNSAATVTLRLTDYDGEELATSSNMEVTLTAYGRRDRSAILPHLAYTENSTQVDFVFDHLEPNKLYNNLRLAVEMATVVSEPKSHFSFQVTRSLDDEYTPGVFKLMEVRSALDEHWIQWRPVCYTSTKRDIGDSTGLYHSQLKNLMYDSLLSDSLLSWLSLGADMRNVTVGGFNVSFGTEGDGFYQASNYTAWTIVTGHGRPVGDKFSLMIILVMAIGLGLPAVVLFLGGMAIAIRNYKNSKDDLLLSD